jgi:hypothetical protein
MPAIAFVVIALLSLLAGALIEPSVAKAATKVRSKALAGPTAVADDKAPYRIVSEDISADTSRRYVAVVLPRRIAEAEIGRIAEVVRAKEKVLHEKTTVNFYLPGMKIGQGAWAVATFAPTLKIGIVGLRLDEEQTALADAQVDRRVLIGVWLTAPPAAPGRLILYRAGAKTFAEWRLRDGSKSVDELVESRDPRGRHLAPVSASGGTEFYLLAWTGELELRDGATVIATAERLPGIGDKITAKSDAPRPRSRSTASTTASAPPGPSLSDKLFKN